MTVRVKIQCLILILLLTLAPVVALHDKASLTTRAVVGVVAGGGAYAGGNILAGMNRYDTPECNVAVANDSRSI